MKVVFTIKGEVDFTEKEIEFYNSLDSEKQKEYRDDATKLIYENVKDELDVDRVIVELDVID